MIYGLNIKINKKQQFFFNKRVKCLLPQFSCIYIAGYPEFIKVITANQPKTRKLPNPNSTPRKFLFFNALIVPKPASKATSPNIITMPIETLLSYDLLTSQKKATFIKAASLCLAVVLLLLWFIVSIWIRGKTWLKSVVLNHIYHSSCGMVKIMTVKQPISGVISFKRNNIYITRF